MAVLLLVFISTMTISFLGALQPGIVNVGTIRIAAQHGRKKAFYYAIGGSLPELVYAYLALLLLNQLSLLDKIMPYLMFVVVLLFFATGIKLIFFEKPFTRSGITVKNNTFFLTAFLISSFNFSVLFFWVSSAGILTNFAIHIHSPLAMACFVAGAVAGNILLLFSLIMMVSKLKNHCTDKNINLLNRISGIIFVISSIFTLATLIF